MQSLEHERAAALRALCAGYAGNLLSTATLEQRVEAVLRAEEPDAWLWDLPRGRRRRRALPAPRWLIVVEDGVTLARLRLPPAPVTRAIGRDEGCWLRVENTSVSRRHALVSRRGDACRIRDLGSTNGTLVNGAAVTVAELLPGDEVRLGEVALYVR